MKDNLMMKKNKVIIQLLLPLLMLLMTALATIADEKKPDLDKVAIVNGTIITRAELNHELYQFKQRVSQQGQEVSEVQLVTIKAKILENLISRELLYQESRSKGIKIDPQATETQLKALKQRFPNKADFKKALSDIKLTEKTLQTRIERDLAIQELVNSQIVPQINISKADNQAFYKDHPEYFKQPEQIKASHILIKLETQSDESQQRQAKKKIEEIQQKLKDGQDFSELAKNFSEGPSNVKGGDLGYFSRGKMVPPFEEAAFALKPGEISDIVQTQYGYHLILVTDRNPEKIINYEDVENKINQYLKQEKVKQEVELYVNKLRDTAEIKTFL
jgi:peptidyl-prolyl cis-trans isomerase C